MSGLPVGAETTQGGGPSLARIMHGPYQSQGRAHCSGVGSTGGCLLMLASQCAVFAFPHFRGLVGKARTHPLLRDAHTDPGLRFLTHLLV